MAEEKGIKRGRNSKARKREEGGKEGKKNAKKVNEKKEKPKF